MGRLVVVALALLLVAIGSSVYAAPPQQFQQEVTSPRSNAVLTGQVSIQGTANHPEFWKYEVRVAPGLNPNVPDEQWFRIAVLEEPVVNGQLAVWDTTAVPDGAYILRLRVVRLDGQWQDLDIRPLNVSNHTPPTATTQPETPTPEEQEEQASEDEGEERQPTPENLPTLTPSSPGTSAGEAPATVEASDETTPSEDGEPTVIDPAPEDETDEEIALGDATARSSSDRELDQATELLNESFDMAGLSSACFTGATVAIGVFLLIGFLFLMKSLMRTFR